MFLKNIVGSIKFIPRPFCFAEFHYPYSKPIVCDCLEKCKYNPPDAYMELIPNDNIIPSKENSNDDKVHQQCL